MAGSQHESDTDLTAVFQGEDPADQEIVVHEGPPGCAGGQIQGQREDQQDCYGWALKPDAGGADSQLALILADGMGGHAGGARASRIVVERFAGGIHADELSISEVLDDSLEDANDAVARAARDDPALHDMGTTLVGAHIAGGRRLRWISVGDSPMWRLADGRLTRLNKDHSMKPVLDQLVEMGQLTAEDAASDRRRHVLRSVVMGDEIAHRDLQDDAVELAIDDVLIIASDGLETLDEAAIVDIVEANRPSATDVATALLTDVRERAKPRQDNATVIVYIPQWAQWEAPTQKVVNPREES